MIYLHWSKRAPCSAFTRSTRTSPAVTSKKTGYRQPSRSLESIISQVTAALKEKDGPEETPWPAAVIGS